MYVACNVLRLSNEARFTSLVLLHRYFGSINETLSVDWKWIAAACLFLGTKTEEESRRLRDIINVAHMLEFDTASQDKTDSSSLETISVKNKPMALDEEYWTAKEKLVATEQKVLRMLQFDCLVSHPHRAVAVLLSDIALDDKQELLLIAWKYLNQALFYALALRYDVLTLACASIECAQQLGWQRTKSANHHYTSKRRPTGGSRMEFPTLLYKNVYRNWNNPLH